MVDVDMRGLPMRDGAAHLRQVERDKLNKYGRPLLGATLKPKAAQCGSAALRKTIEW